MLSRTKNLERITFLDRGVHHSSNDNADPVTNVLVDLSAALAADAPEQMLGALRDKLLKTASNINDNQFIDLVCRGIRICMKMFGGSNAKDEKARTDVQRGVSDLCTFYNMDINACADNLTNSETWKGL